MSRERKLTSSEVHRAALLVSLHDGEPALPREVVRGDVVASLHGLDSTLREHADGQTRGNTESLLGGRDDDIKAPVVEADLLRSDSADGVDGNERVGRGLVDDLGVLLDGGENTGRGVDLGDGNKLVLLLLKGLLKVLGVNDAADLGLDLVDVGAVSPQAVGERVSEVAVVEDELDMVSIYRIQARPNAKS